MRCFAWVVVVAGLAAWCLESARAADNPTGAPDGLRVMTFNIRYDNPGDGENAWPHRKEKVASMVRLYQADVVGMQEALRSQIDQVHKLLPGYDWFGVGRQDGKDAGEFTPIFYRRERMELVEQNSLWLSETPEKAGSRGWDAALPRIATWGKFKDKANGGELYIFNTHFDHVGRVARLESAKLLRAKVAEIAGNQPSVLMGDFNCTTESPPYRWLVGAPVEPPPASPVGAAPAVEINVPPALIDAASVTRRPHHGPTTTWNGFKALVPGRTIDHIFVHGAVQVEQHATLADHWDGRFPSDHLPVLAEIVVTGEQ